MSSNTNGNMMQPQHVLEQQQGQPSQQQQQQQQQQQRHFPSAQPYQNY